MNHEHQRRDLSSGKPLPARAASLLYCTQRRRCPTSSAFFHPRNEENRLGGKFIIQLFDAKIFCAPAKLLLFEHYFF
jgi:hypothetical protein